MSPSKVRLHFKLGKLFDQLEAQNITVLLDLNCCSCCGADMISDAMKASDRGYCVFYVGSTERLRSEGHLTLMCDDYNDEGLPTTGQAVVATAERLGFKVRSVVSQERGSLMDVDLRNIKGAKNIPEAPENNDADDWNRRRQILRSLTS